MCHPLFLCFTFKLPPDFISIPNLFVFWMQFPWRKFSFCCWGLTHRWHDILASTSHGSSRFSSPNASSSSTQSTAAPTRTVSQPVSIPEIPPFRKHDNQHSNYPPSPYQVTSTSSSASPPKLSEIPPFKQRKSKDYVQSEQHMQDGSHPEHQLTIGPTGGAEWTRRLKVADQSPIHRSTDCIVSKDLGTSSDSELLKPAPSWTNVALKTTTEQASTSNSKNSEWQSFSTFLSRLGASAPSVPKATTEEEQRAAEIAAKKSRLKQKLVKSARSVAIFSLKLKERRAREADRIAKEKAEELAQEKVKIILKNFHNCF